MIDTQHNSFMERAMQEARLAYSKGEVPIGAVIVQKGEVIASTHNHVETNSNATHHAEIIALETAFKQIENKRLIDCDLYVTLEPCTMCAGAIAHARIKNLYIAALDPKGGAVFNGVRFFEQPTCHHKINVIHMDSFEENAAQLLKHFFKERR